MEDENRKKSSIPTPSLDMADFETAIEATGYGKFNYLLLLIALPCCFSSVFATTAMSLILPSAECDLNLSLVDKGTLNAVTYGGMISSAFLWGFLSDVLGRRKLLVYGYLLDGFVSVLCALSQNFLSITIFKFISGFIICGPFAVLMSYLSELHGLKYRSRVMMSVGIFFSIASIVLPLLAMLIIPDASFAFKIVVNVLELHTWQTFLLFCSLPSVISGVCVWVLLPESPKFLMSRGRNELALKVFATIHRINYGPNVNFPVKALVVERENRIKTGGSISSKNAKLFSSIWRGIRGGFSQMSVMLEPIHFRNACLVYTIQFCILFGLNTFRLWIVQLFAIIDEFESEFSLDGAPSDANLCTMMDFKVNKTKLFVVDVTVSTDMICKPNVNSSMFINSILIGVIQLVLYLMASSLINAVGNKNILVFGLLFSGTCGIGLYWANSTLTTLLLSAGYIAVASIASTTLLGSVVSLFPTPTRTMNVSLVMMFGRTGAIMGNLLFPWLMTRGCFPPFLMIGATLIVCSFICLLIPKTIKKPLE